VENLNNSAGNNLLDFKKAFIVCLEYLMKELRYDAPMISERTGISKNKIYNIRKNKSSAKSKDFELLLDKFPELNKKFNFKAPKKEIGQSVSDNRVDKLEEEIERLKRQNQEIMLSLIKMQNKLLDR
jgi:hypothetical protein